MRMLYHINFNDGFKLNLLGGGVYSPQTLTAIKNSVLISTVNGVKKALFTTKTDKDGNVWTIDLANLRLRIQYAGGSSSQFTIEYGSIVAMFLTIDSAGVTRITKLTPGRQPDNSAYISTYFDNVSGSYTWAPDIGSRPNNMGLNILTDEKTAVFYSGNSTTLPDYGGSGFDISRFPNSYEEEPEPTDPYDPDGESEPGGGDGEFDDPTDPVPIPDPPSISVADTGFITLFNPSLSELKSLANYMWSDLFSVDSFKKIFADPMHAVLGLSIVPVNVPSAGSREVVVGNISTGISMTVAAKQFVTVDCGSITVKPHWGAYLDYDPYTKSFIYLPFIGMHPVSTDDIMGRTVHIKYNVDVLSGACTAFIESSGVVLYQFIGQVSSCIPITGDNFSSVINGVLGIAGSVGAMVATGGFSAPASVAEAGLGTAYTAGHFISAGASIGQDIMNMKPSIEKSGAMSGTGGIMGVQKPYLIMMRPNVAIPGGQNQFSGYPAHITARLSDLTGFTQVEIIHLENIPCTEKEQEEILHYLAGGVIL